MPNLSRQVELAVCAVDTPFIVMFSSTTYGLISANLIAVDGSGELPSVSQRALWCSLLRPRRFQRPRLVQFFGEPIQWVDTAWCLGMTLVSRSAVKCLVGWGSKAICRGLLTFDVKEKLSFKMSQLLIRQQDFNIFSYATVRISDITLLFVSCDAFLCPFLLFIFGFFSILLYAVLSLSFTYFPLLCFFLFSCLLYSSFSHLND